jgi:hypothetical protein
MSYRLNRFPELPDLERLEDSELKKYDTEVGLLLKSSSSLSMLEEKYKDLFDEVEKLKSEVMEMKGRLFPKVYLSFFNHHSTKERHIVARTSFRIGTNDYKNLRVYVGHENKFKLGKDDPDAILIAEEKMREKIKNEIPLK